MNITGLSRYHQRALSAYLTERHIDGDFSLGFEDSISLLRLDSLWYGGDMVKITYKGYTFNIDASGDIFARVCSARDGSYIMHFKDKHNTGYVGTEIRSYFRSDRTVHTAIDGEHRRYRLELDNNNWWECVVTDPQGRFHDLMWVLDDDSLFAGIAEVLTSLDGIIDELEETA